MNRFKNKIFLLLIVATSAYGTKSSSSDSIRYSKETLLALRANAGMLSEATIEAMTNAGILNNTSDDIGTSS